VTGRGRWVATSGQVALDGEGKLVGPGDPEAQTRRVFANLDRALAAAGASFTDVIKLNYYVTDITMLPLVRTVRDEYVDTARPPASTAVQVTDAYLAQLARARRALLATFDQAMAKLHSDIAELVPDRPG